MKYLLILISFIMTMVFAVTSQAATVCKHGTKERKIEVVYPEGTSGCEVQYTKGSDMQILWTAQTDHNYCVEKAAAFVEKQQGWGWSCETNEVQPATEAVAETTEAVTEAAETTETKIEETQEEKK